jgi:hypothetical protein
MTMAYQLALSDSGRSYLSARGLSREAIDYYRLGQVDVSHAEHESYEGWFSIPYITRAGVVSIKFRNPIPDASPKYISPYPSRLYNPMAMDTADRSGLLAVAEGEFDAQILDFECGIPAVGIPGVDTYNGHPEWKELLKAYDYVPIFQDNDPLNPLTEKRPGEELAKAIMADIDTARVIKLPGQDVTKTFTEHGAAEIRRISGV